MDGILGGEKRGAGGAEGIWCGGGEGEAAAGRSGGLRDQESLPPSFWIAKMRQCGEGALSFAVCSNSITRPMHIHRLNSYATQLYKKSVHLIKQLCSDD